MLDPRETKNLQPGDLLQMAIGQGLMAASPLQLAVGYAAIANGGNVLTPHVVRAVFAPETPDGEPGFVDLTQAEVMSETVPQAGRSRWAEELAGPIIRGVRQNITGPGVNGRSTTAEELFDIGYPEPQAIPIGGKTGYGAGLQELPLERLVDVRGFQSRPGTAVHRGVLPREGRVRLAGAAPVVKCMYLALSG